MLCLAGSIIFSIPVLSEEERPNPETKDYGYKEFIPEKEALASEFPKEEMKDDENCDQIDDKSTE